jgi:predicted dienelactone hydrolase
MWYPAAPWDARKMAEYLPGAWRAALQQNQTWFMRSFFKRDPMAVRTHSTPDAPVSPERPAYPVVMLRPGGSALTTDFTCLAEDLASHGFFVIGFDAPYRSFIVALPSGTVITRRGAFSVENANGSLADPVIGKLLAWWISDTRFIVDQLQHPSGAQLGTSDKRMDLSRLGIVGHSFGGATAMEFCHEDPRCKAAIDLDGIPFGAVVAEGVAKPGMFLLSDHSGEMSDSTSREVLARIDSIYSRLPNPRFYGAIRNASHFAFSDQILLNSQAAVGLLRLTGFGALEGRRGLAISAGYVRTFLDVALNGAPENSLRDLVEKYPEVRVMAP